MKEEGFVRWFSELSNKDIAIAGGKGASLAEMYNNKFPVPPGFVVTAGAYRYFMDASGVKGDIHRMLSEIDIENTALLDKTTQKVRSLIIQADMPKELQEEIVEAYGILDTHNGEEPLSMIKGSKEGPMVAIRSSATTEDLADASFAGQQDSFLAIKGAKNVIEYVKRCFASLFTSRAVYYRTKKGFPHEKSYLAVVVQRMINSEKSGVMFSKNPLVDDNNVVIEAVWGLGEGIVSGKILPDHYVISPENDFSLVVCKISDKKIAMMRNSKGIVESMKIDEDKSKQQVLNSYELKRLAQYGLQLEEHYRKPQDIEFAIENEEIFIVQSRPITTKAKKPSADFEGNVLFAGLPASPGIASGIVKIVHDLEDLGKVKRGDILVTEMTDPDMVVAMQRASGIITDEGGMTSHAAIVSREMGIPAVVGTRVATHKLKDGMEVSVDGYSGRIMEGKVTERKVVVNPVVPTRTKIKVIVDIPNSAARAAESKSAGVGLVRLEGIIAEGGKHPLYYLKKNAIKDYVALLHEGLKTIAVHFKEMWIRSSDVRSDEYRRLEGAPNHTESNPMLGDHGIRFSLKNPDLFIAECTAVKELADEFPNKTFGIMMPQIISAEEVRKSKKLMAEVGLPKNVILGVMIETPASVWIIEDLCKEGIKFASFGTNDLTQYTLALDRNNPEVQDLYNELHPAVIASIKRVIEVCKKYGVETSICGQAGSRPEMAKFLVREGISSISVNADAAESVSKVVAEMEKNFIAHEVPIEQKAPLPMAMSVVEKSPTEEDLILHALDSDYMPSLGKDNDIPSLNDAIPIDSEHFIETKEQKEIEL